MHIQHAIAPLGRGVVEFTIMCNTSPVSCVQRPESEDEAQKAPSQEPHIAYRQKGRVVQT